MRRVARLLSLVLGLALAAAAVLAGIEAVLLAAGQPSLVVPRGTWATDLSHLGWGDTLLDLCAGAAIVVGLAVTAVAVLPRRPVRILVGLPAPGTAWMSRAGLSRRVAHDVGSIGEVERASVRIRGHKVIVGARLAPGVTTKEGRSLVAAAASPVLGRLTPDVPLTVSVRVRPTAEPATTNKAVVGA